MIKTIRLKEKEKLLLQKKAVELSVKRGKVIKESEIVHELIEKFLPKLVE